MSNADVKKSVTTRGFSDSFKNSPLHNESFIVYHLCDLANFLFLNFDSMHHSSESMEGNPWRRIFFVTHELSILTRNENAEFSVKDNLEDRPNVSIFLQST